MNPETAIQAALYQRVREMALTPAVPVIASDKYGDAPKDASGNPTPHIVYQHIPNVNQRLFIDGAAPHRMQGLLQLDLYTPLTMPSIEATVIAGDIAAVFPAGQAFYATPSTPQERVTVHVQRRPDIAPSFTAPPYRRTPITVRYEAFA